MMSGVHRFEKGRVRALEALSGLQVRIAWQRAGQGRVAGCAAAAGRVCRAVYHICKALQRSSHNLLRPCQANTSQLKDSQVTRQSPSARFDNGTVLNLGDAFFKVSNTLLSACTEFILALL